MVAISFPTLLSLGDTYGTLRFLFPNPQFRVDSPQLAILCPVGRVNGDRYLFASC